MYVALSYFVSKVIVAFSFIAVLVAIGTTRLHPFSNQSSMLGTIPMERREKADLGWWLVVNRVHDRVLDGGPAARRVALLCLLRFCHHTRSLECRGT